MILCIVCLEAREKVGASVATSIGGQRREVPVCSECAPEGWHSDRNTFYRVTNGAARNADEYARRLPSNN